MTDAAESKVREWVTKRNGGELTPRDAVDLALAIDEDAVTREARITSDAIARHEETVLLLRAHVVEAKVRDDRLARLEEWQLDSKHNCEARVKKLINEEHAMVHNAYVASLGDTAFQTRLVWFFATGIGKVILVGLGVVVGILLNLLVYGRP